MHDAFFVRGLQGFRDLAHVLESRVEGKGSFGRRALDQLYDQRLIFHAVKLGDVGMVQRGEHLGLALEAGQPFGILRERGG